MTGLDSSIFDFPYSFTRLCQSYPPHVIVNGTISFPSVSSLELVLSGRSVIPTHHYVQY